MTNLKPTFKYKLSIVMPAYNVEQYIRRSLHSILNKTVQAKGLFPFYEVIIIDDGSKDETARIANEVAKKWNEIQPGIVKVIKKENGQYGSVINRGIKEAQGEYFKVLDSDDWFEVESFIGFIFTLIGLGDGGADVIFTDHVYEKVYQKIAILNSFKRYFPVEKIMKIKDARFPKDLITMHSIIYRTELLRKIKYHQVEKIYYSDSQYALYPLCYAETMVYLNIPLYRYFIGRDEQSIAMSNMIRLRDHQLQVLQKLLETINIDRVEYKSIKKYIFLSLRRMLQWQFLLVIFDKQIKHKNKEMKNLFSKVKNIQRKGKNKITNGVLFRIIKISRGVGVKKLIMISFKIYSRIKLKLFDKNTL